MSSNFERKSKAYVMRILILLAVTFLILGCNSSSVHVNTLSEAQISAYNQSVGPWDKVYCWEVETAASRIPRRICQTLQQHALRYEDEWFQNSLFKSVNNPVGYAEFVRSIVCDVDATSLSWNGRNFNNDFREHIQDFINNCV